MKYGAGCLHSSDNTPYEKNGTEVHSIADEVSFDIPNNWEFVHPEDLGFFSSGKTPNPNELSANGAIPYFKVADMNTLGNEEVLTITSAFLSESYRGKLFEAGSIAFPKNGGAVFTNKKRVLKYRSLVDLNTGTFTPFAGVFPRYFFYLFSTVDFTKHFKGTALPTIDMDSVRSIVWGLPPYNEQIRISNCITTMKTRPTETKFSRLFSSKNAFLSNFFVTCPLVSLTDDTKMRKNH